LIDSARDTLGSLQSQPWLRRWPIPFYGQSLTMKIDPLRVTNAETTSAWSSCAPAWAGPQTAAGDRSRAARSDRSGELDCPALGDGRRFNGCQFVLQALLRRLKIMADLHVEIQLRRPAGQASEP
jgi:hypothetical protein